VQEGFDRNLLRAVEVEIIGREACEKKYAGKDIVTPRMVCAGVAEGRKDACAGDGGSALYIKKSGKQIGIVSWGEGCAQKEYPGVYSNLAEKEIHDFIESEVK